MPQIKNIKLKDKSKGYFILIAAVFILAACNQRTRRIQQLQVKVDSLEKKLGETYKPGLGEFMTSIQLHHAKLWFAGQNQNWPLADFEVHEIQESIDDIQHFCKDRPEVKAIGMINPPIGSIIHAVQQKDLRLFKNNFVLLTNTCNSCHKTTEHAFNIVTVPVRLPVANQDFRVYPLK